jgi:ubiquinone/menaquinone biosynthesis C-methylase UbiE
MVYTMPTPISHVFFGWIDLLEKFGKVAGMRVLDVGCGSGGMPIAMLKRGAIEACGVEVDKSLYEICGTRFKSIPSVKVFLGDGKTLPFDNNSFDIITCIHVIEHVSHIKSFLAEIFRVLRKGGRCILECPNRFFPLEPHNKIPLITYLPKGIADILCAGVFSKFPLFKADMRLRMKNVASFKHFISTGKLERMVKKMGGHILLKNPVERFIGRTIIPKNILDYLGNKTKLMKFISHWVSRDAMIIFTK